MFKAIASQWLFYGPSENNLNIYSHSIINTVDDFLYVGKNDVMHKNNHKERIKVYDKLICRQKANI